MQVLFGIHQSLFCFALACELNVVATLRAFCVELYLGHSDGLKLLGCLSSSLNTQAGRCSDDQCLCFRSLPARRDGSVVQCRLLHHEPSGQTWLR